MVRIFSQTKKDEKNQAQIRYFETKMILLTITTGENITQNLDLGAPKHLYNWVCPLVGWSIGLSISRSRIRSTTYTAHLIGLLGLVSFFFFFLPFLFSSLFKSAPSPLLTVGPRLKHIKPNSPNGQTG